MAQKKELSQARTYIKSKKNYDKAEQLMTGLLKDSANHSNKRIYQVWLEAVKGQYDQANERMYLKQRQDTAAFFALTLRMFTVAETLDSIEMNAAADSLKLVTGDEWKRLNVKKQFYERKLQEDLKSIHH